jgi:SSS family solute:Na+ symporter
VVAMLGGLVIVPIVSMITKKPDEKIVNDAFASYERTITVKVSESLGDDEEEGSIEQ